jgi:hypothetical protein
MPRRAKVRLFRSLQATSRHHNVAFDIVALCERVRSHAIQSRDDIVSFYRANRRPKKITEQ